MNNKQEHLSDYERAIFYYTMPKITTPFPVKVVVIYAGMLFLALGALVYGVSQENMEWIRSGTIGLCFGGVVGVIAFLSRDFINQVRKGSALAAAKGIPDADSQFDDIPNPFGEHILLSNPIRHDDTTMPLKNNKGKTIYTAELVNGGKEITLYDEAHEKLFQASLKSHSPSFSFEGGGARQVQVETEAGKVAEVIRYSSIRLAETDIQCMDGDSNHTYKCLSGGIYLDDALVGRIYEVRGHHYLDIERKHLCAGILAFFVTLG